jgi:hypothetical protein
LLGVGRRLEAIPSGFLDPRHIQRIGISKYQYPQQDAEDEDDQEDGKGNEEQNLGNGPGAFGDSSETEETGNE